MHGRRLAMAPAAAVPQVDEEPWSAEAGPAEAQQVVIPIGALSRWESAGFSSISSISDCIAAGPPAAAAALMPAGLLPAVKMPAAARDSWSSTADGYQSSLSNAGSSAAAAAAVPTAAAPATAIMQPVQLWPINSCRQQRPLALPPSLQLEPSPDHQQQLQRQQQPSSLAPQADAVTASCSNSMTRTSASRRSVPSEAQTWLVMEYCDRGWVGCGRQCVASDIESDLQFNNAQYTRTCMALFAKHLGR